MNRVGSSKSFWGFILIPSKDLKTLKDYLKQCEEEGQIFLYDYARVRKILMSNSTILYEKGTGWRSISKSELNRLKRLNTQKSLDNLPKHPGVIFSPPFKTKWLFNEDGEDILPSKFIELYCKAHHPFSFAELPSKLYSKQSSSRFTKKEWQLLFYLQHKKVLQVRFNPIRLISDFALERYWIQIPHNTEFTKIQYLLYYFPLTRIFITETSIHLWTVLNSEFVQWFNKELKWPIQPTQTQYGGKNPRVDWFDTHSCEWKTPLILKDLA